MPPIPLFNLVLCHPEIPNNTGNIGRTAVATGCRLHIIHPIGFEMSEKARRRAGLDYWHVVDCVEHESWEAFVENEGVKASRRQGVGRHQASNPSCDEWANRDSINSLATKSSFWLYTTQSARPHWEANFRRGDYLLFGRETSGAPVHVHTWVREQFGEDHRVTLPMVADPAARSLNLATAVCAAVYEGMRQLRSHES